MKDKPSEKDKKRPLFYFIYLGQLDLEVRKRPYKFSSYGDITSTSSESIFVISPRNPK
ncbi:hypothetical protein BDV59DRAFT_187968 [Aspergillus ambiguus]|uniref:uncharacterized protein n=1 Tax=Aspergillus ambiguus TaxID=176160 RepID=UPI003CCE0D64